MTKQPNLWDNSPREPRRVEPGGAGQFNVPARRSSGIGGFFRTVFWLAVLVAAGWAAWRYGTPVYNRFRASSEVERQAGAVLSHVPKAVNNEEALRAVVAEQMSGALQTHEAAKANWYVIFGPRGQEVRVIRDDKFEQSDKAFVERLIDEGRLRTDTAGAQRDVFTYPLGALYKTVNVDGQPWCVAVGWREK